MHGSSRSIGKGRWRMARVVSMPVRARHLYWRADGREFVTLCDDGSVIFRGRVTTLEAVTALLLKDTDPRLLWE